MEGTPESQEPEVSESLDRGLLARASTAGDVRAALVVGTAVAALVWLARAALRLLGRPL